MGMGPGMVRVLFPAAAGVGCAAGVSFAAGDVCILIRLPRVGFCFCRVVTSFRATPLLTCVCSRDGMIPGLLRFLSPAAAGVGCAAGVSFAAGDVCILIRLPRVGFCFCRVVTTFRATPPILGGCNRDGKGPGLLRSLSAAAAGAGFAAGNVL